MISIENLQSNIKAIENIEEAKTVRVTADAIQIEPLRVAPAVALPMLMVLLVVLLIKTRKKKK